MKKRRFMILVMFSLFVPFVNAFLGDLVPDINLDISLLVGVFIIGMVGVVIWRAKRHARERRALKVNKWITKKEGRHLFRRGAGVVNSSFNPYSKIQKERRQDGMRLRIEHEVKELTHMQDDISYQEDRIKNATGNTEEKRQILVHSIAAFQAQMAPRTGKMFDRIDALKRAIEVRRRARMFRDVAALEQMVAQIEDGLRDINKRNLSLSSRLKQVLDEEIRELKAEEKLEDKEIELVNAEISDENAEIHGGKQMLRTEAIEINDDKQGGASKEVVNDAKDRKRETVNETKTARKQRKKSKKKMREIKEARSIAKQAEVLLLSKRMIVEKMEKIDTLLVSMPDMPAENRSKYMAELARLTKELTSKKSEAEIIKDIGKMKTLQRKKEKLNRKVKGLARKEKRMLDRSREHLGRTAKSMTG